MGRRGTRNVEERGFGMEGRTGGRRLELQLNTRTQELACRACDFRQLYPNRKRFVCDGFGSHKQFTHHPNEGVKGEELWRAFSCHSFASLHLRSTRRSYISARLQYPSISSWRLPLIKVRNAAVRTARFDGTGRDGRDVAGTSIAHEPTLIY